MNFKKITYNIKVILGALVALLLLTLFSVKVPEMHSDYIRHNVGQAVVKVLRTDSGGTGFHIQAPSGQTYIMTNRHVCSDKVGDILSIETDSGKKMDRRIVAIYELHDLCLVEPLPGVKGLELGSGLTIGSSIGIVGHPLLSPLTYKRGTVVAEPTIEVAESFNITPDKCRGRYVDLSGTMHIFFGLSSLCMGTYKTQQVDYIAYKGNSGSPAVNIYGNVVGVHFAGNQNSITIGYIVPLNYVRHFLKDY